MQIFKTKKHLLDYIEKVRNSGKTIGFVPTMGALHKGHISLISNSLMVTDICISSIFVNPTQFNNPEDFAKYPITIDQDINALEENGCHCLFLPSVEEMYPPNEPAIHYNLGYIEKLWEGEFRPGHFQGVCQIVDKFLSIIAPDKIFMGKKDYQQCMVIAKLIELKNHPTQLVIAPTVREKDGLAMSSRNTRLDMAARQNAINIIKILQQIKDNLQPGDINQLVETAKQHLSSLGYQTDYIGIANAKTLEPVTNWNGQLPVVALVAATINNVRLIDNLILHEA